MTVSAYENGGVSASNVQDWIKNRIGEYANIPASQISNDADFQSFGIDSARAVSLMMDLEQWLDLDDELPLELLFEAQSIGEAGQKIAAEASRTLAGQPQ